MNKPLEIIFETGRVKVRYMGVAGDGPFFLSNLKDDVGRTFQMEFDRWDLDDLINSLDSLRRALNP